ncbi:peptidase M16 inactive domain-containing protein [Apiospora arundinis]
MSLGQAPVDLYAHDAVDSAWYHGECDPAKVRCYLWAIRADYEEDTEYLTHDTEDLMATRLEIRLNGNNACSKEELSSIKRISDGSGIRLLSPDSVVPARPLLNGFCATSFDKSLDLLK